MEILECSDEAIYVTTIDTRELLFLNSAAKQYCRKHYDSYNRMKCYDVFLGNNEPCPFCKIKNLTEGEIYAREFTHPISHRILQLKGSIIEWNGKPAHIEYISDITNQKNTEEKEKQLSIQLDTIFAYIPYGICSYRYIDGKIIDVKFNELFHEIMCYSKEHWKEVLEGKYLTNIHPGDVDMVQKWSLDGIKNGGCDLCEYRFYNDKLHSYRIIRVTSNIDRLDNNELYISCFYEDVTD